MERDLENQSPAKDLLMKRNKSSLLCILVLSFSGLISAQEASRPHPEAALSLRDGWTLQSSCKVDDERRDRFHSRLPAQGLV